VIASGHANCLTGAQETEAPTETTTGEKKKGKGRDGKGEAATADKSATGTSGMAIMPRPGYDSLPQHHDMLKLILF
jgi:hypothetical protein